ncbi:hypothetical protein [Methanobrevibacter sp. DSM 116169]|uniref:hypothetical protein n=1 Tax=Methanobrevibacter sp. DSM 116169 TaxID=3242727 RepID=UPI0038FC2133
MKIKNIVILLMLLFLSISAVSANDLADENNDLIIDDNNNYDIMADEIDSYTKLNESIATKDVVDLNGNTVLYGENDTNFINGININKTVTIQNGIIDGNNTAAFFNIENGNLILINITLQNGFNVDLLAPIAAIDSNLTIENCEFINNTGDSSVSGVFPSSVLYVTESYVDIKNSNFTDNMGLNWFGAIVAKESEFNIDSSNFINNIGKNSGVINTFLSNFTITKSTFKGNKVTSNDEAQGGAIYFAGSTFSIEETDFEDNSARGGAAICILDSNGTISKSNFINNSGEVASVINAGLANVDIIESNFINNTAVENIIHFGFSNITISKSVFTNNNVSGRLFGEASEIITIRDSYVDMDEVEFSNNFASDSVYNNGDLLIFNSSFKNEDVEVIINSQGNLTVVDSEFVNNNVSYVIASDAPNGNFTIVSSDFNDNIAFMIIGTSNNAFIIDSKFDNNNVSGIVESYGNLTIDNSEFINNLYNNLQAIIMQDCANGYLLLKNSLFESEDIPVLTTIGNIYLENNIMNTNVPPIVIVDVDYSINNITSPTFLTILDNKTIDAKIGDVINLTAYLTDDNGNIIVFATAEYDSDKGEFYFKYANFTFTIDGNNFSTNKTSIEGVYYYEYNVTDLGVFVVSGDSEYCNNLTIDYGVLDVGNPDLGVNIESPISSDENSTVTVTMDANATGNVTVVVNGTNYLVNMTNGTGVINLPNLAPGTYNVTVSYVGGGDFYPVTYNGTLVVKDDLKSVLVVADLVKYYRNGSQLIAYLTNLKGEPLSGMNVTFFINGRNYTKVTNATGHAVLSINLEAGNYSVLTIFNATGNYSDASYESHVEVKSTISGEDVTKFYRNGTQYYATLVDGTGKALANTNVTMNINGVMYTRTTNENGTVMLNINLDPNEYVITVDNPVTNQSFSNLITVKSTIEGENVTKMYKNDTQYYATLYNADGSVLANTNVSMNINGVMYIRETNENGTVKLNINLDPDEYVITVYNPVNNQSFSNLVTVLPILVGENLNKTFGILDQYEVAAFDEVGNPAIGANVTININGVMYYRISGDDGVAKLNINLNVGSYIATATWKGYSTSNIINVVE